MKLSATTVQTRLPAAFLTAILLCGCDSNAKSLKRPHMTALSPRLEVLFQKSKTVCFSHFIMEVPSTAEVVYGPAEVEADLVYYPGEASSIDRRVAEQLVEIEKDRIFLNVLKSDKLPLFGTIIEGSRPGSRIAFGSKSQVGYDLYSFFTIEDDLFVQSLKQVLKHEDHVSLLNSVASNLRLRANNEIPTEAGSCIDGAFIPIPLEYERVTVGVRLKEFPDVHFSIEVHKNQTHIPELSDLETRLQRAAQEGGKWYSRIKFLRRGERQLGSWKGSEALVLKPAQETENEAHEFHFISLGEPDSPLVPGVDIQLDTGASRREIGAVRPSITDEEAVAVWDKLTGSIRVRPVSGPKPVKTPLTSTAETGAMCPESGWWQCDERGVLQSDRRKHVVAGDPMPYTTVLGHQTLWQKLSGEHPKYRAATMWKLVEYDAAPLPTENDHA